MKCQISDGSSSATLNFFHFNGSQKNSFRVGRQVKCFGEFKHGYQGIEVVHPDYSFDDFEKNDQDIAHQIDRIDTQSDYVKQLRKNAQFGLTEKYNWEHVSNQYYQLFISLLK